MTASTISAGDTAWVCVSTALVLRLAAVSVQWTLIGYSLAFAWLGFHGGSARLHPLRAT